MSEKKHTHTRETTARRIDIIIILLRSSTFLPSRRRLRAPSPNDGVVGKFSATKRDNISDQTTVFMPLDRGRFRFFLLIIITKHLIIRYRREVWRDRWPVGRSSLQPISGTQFYTSVGSPPDVVTIKHCRVRFSRRDSSREPELEQTGFFLKFFFYIYCNL